MSGTFKHKIIAKCKKGFSFLSEKQKEFIRYHSFHDKLVTRLDNKFRRKKEMEKTKSLFNDIISDI